MRNDNSILIAILSLLAPLAQLVQSACLTSKMSVVRIHQGAQTVNSRTDWPGGETANTEGCLV
jgi:hypothetical protein